MQEFSNSFISLSLVGALTACQRGIRGRRRSKIQPRGHWEVMPRGWGSSRQEVIS